MSLIKCPECTAEISDTVNSCIKCGYVLKKVSAKKSGPSGCFVSFFVIIFIGLVLFIVFMLNVKPDINSNAFPSKTSAKEEARQYYIDEIVPTNNFYYSVKSIKWQNYIENEIADSSFLIIDISINNKSNTPQNIPEIYLTDKNLKKIFQSSSKGLLLKDRIYFYSSLNPDVWKFGKIVFDVPKIDGYKLVVHGKAGDTNNPELINLIKKQ